MRRMTMRWVMAAVCGVLASGAWAEGLKNLPPTKTPRFAITDRDWPAKPGEASICLWKDDKVAAASITIDDNLCYDHPWWIEQSEKYGFKFTWFVVTGGVGGSNKKLNGTWDQWQKLREMGHDIQSHTFDHFGGPNPSPAEINYTKSIEQLEAGLPGHKVLTLAYPGGKNSKMNSVDEAAKHYIAARGTVGKFNAANSIDYRNTNSISGPPSLDADHKWAGFPNMLTLNPKQKSVYRGWCSIHFHGVKEVRDRAIATLDFMKENEANLWVGTFTHVAQYGQQRDTAKLAASVSTGKVTLTVTDQMDDALFDYPLTVKVRLDPAWKSPKATQAGKSVALTVTEHEGGSFALVDVIPDRGEVVLSAAGD